MDYRQLEEVRRNPFEKPEPLIDGIINQGELILLTGQWDSFKSRVSAEFARSISTGEPLFGHFHTHAVRPVLIIQKEINKAFYDERIIGLMAGTPDDTPLYISYDQHFKFNRGYGTELAELIDQLKLGLVIFDPLTYFWPDGSFDENSSGDVSGAIGPILRLRDTGCSFIFVHHDPKPSLNGAGVARGSSVLVNAPDARILLHRETDEDSVTIRCRTRNIKPPAKFRAKLDIDRLVYDGKKGVDLKAILK